MGVKAPQWQSLSQGIMKEASTIGLDTVQLKLPKSDAEIYADPFLSRVFYNLIDNSFRHGGSVRNITVETEVIPDGSLLIRYRDDGTGVSPDEKDLIFEQGYGKNTGFGLFIIREILGITGLTIRETGTIGSGVLFEITVPKRAWKPVSGKKRGKQGVKRDT
ncbi:ATP-binding protein [Methanoregula sp.]|uniref:ATP-binding protein n=1 Tax=Methanoregula sp. TaxID=2052170 RepID=UPI003C709680